MKKRQAWGTGILLGCLILSCGALVRATEETLILIAEDHKVKAELSPPDNRDIVSLQFSFQIDVPAEDAGKGQVSFEFDSGINSGVKTYRYHPDTGVLTVYISGKEALFASEKLNDQQALTLGNVVFEPDMTADVGVREGSLVTMVNDGFDLQKEKLLSAGAHVTADKGNPNPEEPGGDEEEDWRPVEDVVNPGSGEKPGGAENPGGTENPGSSDNLGSTENPGGSDNSGGSDGVWSPGPGGGNVTRPEDTRPEGGWTGYNPPPENTAPVNPGTGTEPDVSTPGAGQPAVVPPGDRGILSAYKRVNRNNGTNGLTAQEPSRETTETEQKTGEDAQKDPVPEEESQRQENGSDREQVVLEVEKPGKTRIGTVAKVLLGVGLAALLILGAGVALVIMGDRKKRMSRLRRLRDKRKQQQ